MLPSLLPLVGTSELSRGTSVWTNWSADCSSWTRTVPLVRVVEDEEDEDGGGDEDDDEDEDEVEVLGATPAAESEQRNDPMATALLAWDPTSPLELAVKLAPTLLVKTLPTGCVPAASLKAWQKTPGENMDAATSCELWPEVGVSWSRLTLSVVAASPSPVLMVMVMLSSRAMWRGAAQAMAARRRAVAALNMVVFILGLSVYYDE